MIPHEAKPEARAPNPDAIVFDFDGVLVNTEPLHERAYQHILAPRGVTLTHERYYAEYLGYDDVGVFEAISRDFNLRLDAAGVRTLIDEKSRAFASLVDPATVLFAGARECIARCAAVAPLAIASGALRQEIELILTRTGLRDAFGAIVGADDTARSKPAPDPYARAVSLMAADPSRSVAIEDSRWGIESARAAGLRVIGIATTYTAGELGAADCIVSSLDEITAERLGAIINQRANDREHP